MPGKLATFWRRHNWAPAQVVSLRTGAGVNVLTLAQAAELLQLSPRTLTKLAVAGTIIGRKVGNQWRFLRTDLEGRAHTPGKEQRIYFLQAGGPSGPVKIGVSRDVKKRLKAVRTGAHQPVVLLGTMFGNATTEARLHAQFAGLRIRGEWFRPEEPLMRLVRRAVRA